MLGVVWRGDDREIRETLPQPLERVVAAAVPQAVVYVWVLLLEAGYPAGGKEWGAALDYGDVYRAGYPVFKAHDVVPRFFRKVEYALGAAVKQASGLGELQAPLAAHKQLRAELLLQRLYLIAQRRLAHAQPFGCVRYVQLLGHNREVFQRSQFHGFHLAVIISKKYDNCNGICILFNEFCMLLYVHICCDHLLS